MKLLKLNSFDLNLPYFEVQIDNKALKVITIFFNISDYNQSLDLEKSIKDLNKKLIKYKNKVETFFLYSTVSEIFENEALEMDLKLKKCILLSDLSNIDILEKYFIDKNLFDFFKKNLYDLEVYISGYQVYFSLLNNSFNIKEKDIAEDMSQLHVYYDNINNLSILLNLEEIKNLDEEYYFFALRILEKLKDISPLIKYRKPIGIEIPENKALEIILQNINDIDLLVKALYNYENVGYISQLPNILSSLQDFNALEEVLNFVSLGYEYIKKMIKSKKFLLFSKINSNFFKALEHYTTSLLQRISDPNKDINLEEFSFEKVFLYFFIKYFYSYSFIEVPINSEKLDNGNILDYTIFFNYVNYFLKNKSQEELKYYFKTIFINEYFIKYNEKFILDSNLEKIKRTSIEDFIETNFSISEYEIISLFLNIFPYILDRKIALEYFKTSKIFIENNTLYPEFFKSFFISRNPFTKKSKFFSFNFDYKDILLISSCNIPNQNSNILIDSDEFLNRLYISGNLLELYSLIYLKNMVKKFKYLNLNTIQSKALENFLSQYNIIPSKYNYSLYITGNFYSSLPKNYFYLLTSDFKIFYNLKSNIKGLPILSFNKELFQKKVGNSILALVSIDSPLLLKNIKHFLTEFHNRNIIEINIYKRGLTSLLNFFLNFEKENLDISDLFLFLTEESLNENKDIPFILKNFKEKINNKINIYIFILSGKGTIKKLINNLYFFKDKMKKKRFFIVPMEVRNG